MSAIDNVNDATGPQRSGGLNKPAATQTQSERAPLVAKDFLELSSSRLAEVEKQVEAEFEARKARVLAKEQAGHYDPDQAMGHIAKLLAEGYVEHR